MKRTFTVETLDDTKQVGQEIASMLTFPSCVYLHGGMGVGKTTLTKSILRGLGYHGAVTSPTYNLVQEYQVGRGLVYHMDLYRLEDPGELEFLALEDLWSESSLFLVEWPSKGGGMLRAANVQIDIKIINCLDGVKREIILF